ncbi:hypothetical protein NKY41_31200, partial [Sinorhizobium meliloti]
MFKALIGFLIRALSAKEVDVGFEAGERWCCLCPSLWNSIRRKSDISFPPQFIDRRAALDVFAILLPCQAASFRLDLPPRPFIAFLEAAGGTRKPSPRRMLAMTFMRLWKCISFFDGEPRLRSSIGAVTGSGFCLE